MQSFFETVTVNAELGGQFSGVAQLVVLPVADLVLDAQPTFRPGQRCPETPQGAQGVATIQTLDAAHINVGIGDGGPVKEI
ncbi:MAG: hypothetical protein R3F31_05265 [Verrucomicrobiales bacterium]